MEYNRNSKVKLEELIQKGYLLNLKERLDRLVYFLKLEKGVEIESIIADEVQGEINFNWKFYNPYKAEYEFLKLKYILKDCDYYFNVRCKLRKTFKTFRRNRVIRGGSLLYKNKVDWSCIWSFILNGKSYDFGELGIIHPMLALIQAKVV